MASITLDHCKQWMSFPSINPLTGRKISIHGRIFGLFKQQCIANGLESEKNLLCEAKWIVFNSKEADLYDKSLLKMCKHCKKSISYSILHFIHARDDNSIADYECTRCKKSGNLAYFCLKCRNIDNEE